MANSLGTIYAELRLQLDKFNKDVANAKIELKNMSDETVSSLSGIADTGRSMQKAGAVMSAAVTAPLVAIGTQAVKASTSFEQAMSLVKAVGETTGAEFQKLKDLAMEQGAATKFSALESAQAMGELMKLGFTTEEVFSALPATLAVAAAGGVELADASMIVAKSMNMFGESADQTGRYADVFAKAAAIGALDVKTLGEALSYAGPSAAAMGYSLEETTAALAVFSDAGIDSTRAGTQFEALMRDMKRRALANGGALKFMAASGKEVEVSLYDAQGKMRPLVGIIADIEANTKGMTDAQRDAALSHIATTQGLRGLNVLLGKGADYLQDYTDRIYDSAGAGQGMADTMQNNLAGALEQMRGSIETAAIAIGEVLTPFVKAAAGVIKRLADWFTRLSPTGKKVVVVILALVAAIGPLLLIVGTIATVFATLSLAAGAAGITIGAMIAPVLLAVAGFVALIAIIIAVILNWDKIVAAAKNFGSAIKEWVVDAIEKVKTKFSEWGQALSDLGSKIGTWVGDVLRWFGELPGKIASAVVTFFTVTLPGWFSDAFVAISTFVSDGINNVVTFFSELPGKVGAFLLDLFFVKIPYWIGFGIGTMIRLVMEGVTNVVTWFSELPGKVLTFLTTLWTNITTKFTEIKDAMILKVTEAIDSVVTWFSGLPTRVMLWVTTLWNNIVLKFTEIKDTMILKVTEAINAVVEWFMGLPAKVWTWLVNTKTKIVNFGAEALTAAKEAGQKIVDGVIDTITGLPGLVWDVFLNVKTKIGEAASGLWGKAKSTAGSLWQGFKDGLGIHSPSYLEEAMFNIMATSKDLIGSMKSDFRTLGSLKVNPPSLTAVNAGLLTDMQEANKLINADAKYSYANAFKPSTAEQGTAGEVKTGDTYSIVVNNPKPEPASDSVRTVLLKQSYGLLGDV